MHVQFSSLFIFIKKAANFVLFSPQLVSDVICCQGKGEFQLFFVFLNLVESKEGCMIRTQTCFRFALCWELGRVMSWQIWLNIIRLSRQMMHFAFGRSDKTHSWLHKKLIIIKFTTCGLKKRRETRNWNMKNCHRLFFATERNPH